MREPTLESYIEEMGLHFEQAGLTRTAGRIIGYLLVCDPPQQTLNDLVSALRVSKSSASTETRTLIRVGLVERVSMPGERRDYYRMAGDIWNRSFKDRLSQITAIRKLAERGLAALGNVPKERKQRLEEMREMYAFFEREMPKLIDRWEEEKAAKEAQQKKKRGMAK